MSTCINISVGMSIDGVHYDGISIHNGVNFDLVDAPCGSDRKLVSLTNGIMAPEGIFWDACSALDADGPSVSHYYQVFAQD